MHNVFKKQSESHGWREVMGGTEVRGKIRMLINFWDHCEDLGFYSG